MVSFEEAATIFCLWWSGDADSWVACNQYAINMLSICYQYAIIYLGFMGGLRGSGGSAVPPNQWPEEARVHPSHWTRYQSQHLSLLASSRLDCSSSQSGRRPPPTGAGRTTDQTKMQRAPRISCQPTRR